MATRIAIAFVTQLFIAHQALAWNPETACPTPPDDSLQTQILAGKLFNEADEAYKAHRSVEALQSFLCSHNIIQHENTLFNIAQISKLNEVRNEALALLKDYVAHAKGSNKVDPIQDIIDELEKRPISGKAATGPEPPAEPTATVTDTPQTPMTSTESSDAPLPRPEKKWPRPTGLALMSLGGAVLIAGAVFQGLAGGAKSTAQEATTLDRFDKAEERMNKLETGAIIGFVAGSVVAGSGLVIYLVVNKKPREQQEARISILPCPAGIMMRGGF